MNVKVLENKFWIGEGKEELLLTAMTKYVSQSNQKEGFKIMCIL